MGMLRCGSLEDAGLSSEGIAVVDRMIGEVHDENAARLGGVAAHAGLFATARAVAVLGQCHLNGEEYGGAQLLSPALVHR